MYSWKSRIDDFWNVDGDRNLSEPWTGFTSSQHEMKNLQTGFRDHLVTRNLVTHVKKKAAQRREMPQWAIEKPKLERERELRGIYFINLEDSEFKETMKKTHGKRWNCRWDQPCFVRSGITTAGNPAAKNPALADQSMHASWKLKNLRESVWKELCLKIMKIALQKRDLTHQVTIILCTSLSPCLKHTENTGCHSSGGQRMGKARKFASMANDQSKEQKRGHPRGTERAEQLILLC